MPPRHYLVTSRGARKTARYTVVSARPDCRPSKPPRDLVPWSCSPYRMGRPVRLSSGRDEKNRRRGQRYENKRSCETGETKAFRGETELPACGVVERQDAFFILMSSCACSRCRICLAGFSPAPGFFGLNHCDGSLWQSAGMASDCDVRRGARSSGGHSCRCFKI
jgi:hypothetical protein